MVKQTLVLVAAGLLMVGCSNGSDKPADAKTEMTASAPKADASKAAAPIQYAEIKQGESTWVVGTAEGAAAVKAGKKPAHVTSIMGGKKIYFEQDKEGKVAPTLMAEYDKRHAKK
jgi:hypothetical protein